jgi:hypothetical protein
VTTLVTGAGVTGVTAGGIGVTLTLAVELVELGAVCAEANLVACVVDSPTFPFDLSKNTPTATPTPTNAMAQPMKSANRFREDDSITAA